MEFWQQAKIDGIQWMFSGKKEIDQETEQIIQQRQDLLPKVGLLKTVYQGKHTIKHFEKLAKVIGKLPGLVAKTQER